MIVRATVDKGEFKKGVEYDLPTEVAQAMIIAGTMTFVAVAPAHNREKAILEKWDTRLNSKEQVGR